MPTKLTKPVTRELELLVDYGGKERNLLVTIESDKLVFRPKGTQKRYEVKTFDLYDALSSGELCLNRQCEAVDPSDRRPIIDHEYVDDDGDGDCDACDEDECDLDKCDD